MPMLFLSGALLYLHMKVKRWMMEKKKVDSYGQRDDISKVIQAIQSVQYGAVTVIIQDGRIVQLEKNVKERL